MTATLNTGEPVEPKPDSPVLVVDDHELFSTSLVLALRSQGLDAAVLTVARVRDLLRSAPPETVGLVVLDLDLGQDGHGNRLNGADLVEGFRRRGWKVLVVSGATDRSAAAAAIAAGAVGSMTKSSTFDELVRTVLALLGGESVMSEAERQDWLDCHRRYLVQETDLAKRFERLSPREFAVLELLAEGMRAASIADYFVVSMPTVRSQIRSILVKLQAGSQLEAVALFRRHRYGRSGDGTVDR